MSIRRRRLFQRCLRAAVLASVVAAPLHAQVYGDGFLFHAPNVRIGVRGGYSHASAGSDLFAFTTDQLTLKRSDFSGLNAGLELAMPLGRIDLTLDAGYSRARKGSEFRKFVDNNPKPDHARYHGSEGSGV